MIPQAREHSTDSNTQLCLIPLFDSLISLSPLSLCVHLAPYVFCISQIEQPDATIYLAVAPGQTSYVKFKSVKHVALLLRKKICGPSLKSINGLEELHISAIRISLVLNQAKIPAELASLCRKAKGMALAMNAAQQEWCVLMGIWPLNSNKTGRAKFEQLVEATKTFPINRILEGGEPATAEELSPFHDEARRRWPEFEALATRCPHQGVFGEETCNKPSCRHCRKR